MRAWRTTFRGLAAGRGITLRFAAFFAVAVIALALGFIVPSPTQADWALRHFGYYLMLAAFAACAWAIGRWIPAAYAATLRCLEWRAIVPAAIVIAGILWLGFASEPRGFKVVNDEYVLQATALNLHLEREPAALVRGYYINGTFRSLAAYTDKRPFTFPFLLSLVHDLTGYRIANAFFVNYALAAINLWLVFVLARRLGGSPALALACVVIWGGLPLFVQNANGSGMEMLNVTLIAFLILIASDFLSQPDERRLNVLVFVTILLAQTRYESVLFVPVTGIVALIGWSRARRLFLPWPVILAPLLLLPYAFQHQITAANKALWELQPTQEHRFALEYLLANIRGAWEFYFAWQNRMIANSWLLSFLSVVALGAIIARWKRLDHTSPAAHASVALVTCGVAVLVNLGVLMFYYWGKLSDPVVARLALPSLLLGTLLCAWAAGRFTWSINNERWIFLGAIVYVIGFMRPQMANRYYTEFNQPVRQVLWEKEVLARRPPMDRLIISNKTALPWIIQLQPAVILGQARERRAEFQFHLAAGTFGEIIVTQRLQPSTSEGGFVVDPADALPPDFELEVIAEKRFGATLGRISKLTWVGSHSDSPGQ